MTSVRSGLPSFRVTTSSQTWLSSPQNPIRVSRSLRIFTRFSTSHRRTPGDVRASSEGHPDSLRCASSPCKKIDDEPHHSHSGFPASPQ